MPWQMAVKLTKGSLEVLLFAGYDQKMLEAASFNKSISQGATLGRIHFSGRYGARVFPN
jgi:hypothetical protein